MHACYQPVPVNVCSDRLWYRASCGWCIKWHVLLPKIQCLFFLCLSDAGWERCGVLIRRAGAPDKTLSSEHVRGSFTKRVYTYIMVPTLHTPTWRSLEDRERGVRKLKTRTASDQCLSESINSLWRQKLFEVIQLDWCNRYTAEIGQVHSPLFAQQPGKRRPRQS